MRGILLTIMFVMAVCDSIYTYRGDGSEGSHRF